MRSIWKGSIAFGLVNVPVKMYSATNSHDIGLHQVHDEDGGRIHYQRKCEICGKVVSFEHIEKAYEEREQRVVLSNDDLNSLPAERSREIDVVEFVPSDQIDPIRYGSSYFLEPASDSPKAYVLLRETLKTSHRTAIVKFALRQKSRLGVLRVYDDVLLVQSLLWDDEVRQTDFPSLTKDVTISPKERELSATLVDSFADDFHPEKFKDEYQAQLRELIKQKMEHGESLITEEPVEAHEGEVIDLLAALRDSVEKSRRKTS